MRYTAILIILLLVFTPLPSAAQSASPTPTPCASPLLELLQKRSSRLDFPAGCQVVESCSEVTFSGFDCPLPIAAALAQTCVADDSQCLKSAIFAAAMSKAYISKDSFDDAVQMFIAFDKGDYIQAYTLYKRLQRQYSNTSPHYLFLAGYLQEQQNAPGLALEQYNEALEMYAEASLIYLVRAPLLASMGKTLEASFDAEWLRQAALNDPQVMAFVQPVVDLYPLDRTRLENWMLYPMMSYSSSPGGRFYFDDTLEASGSFQIAAYPELDGWVALGLIRAFYPTTPIHGDVHLMIRSGDTYEYLRDPLEFTEYFRISFAEVSTEDQPRILIGTVTSTIFEGHGTRKFFIVPEGSPDPRQGIPGERCGQGAISRLRPGMNLDQLLWDYFDPELYDAPEGTAIGTTTAFQILSDSECLGDTWWWQVQTLEGTTAWVRENEGTDYLLNPPDTARQWLQYCPGILPTQFIVGQQGRVVAGLGKNNLRIDAGDTREIIGQLEEAEIFTVIDGPMCQDQKAWYKVETTTGLQGWTAEGEGEVYWLAPVENR